MGCRHQYFLKHGYLSERVFVFHHLRGIGIPTGRDKCRQLAQALVSVQPGLHLCQETCPVAEALLQDANLCVDCTAGAVPEDLMPH